MIYVLRWFLDPVACSVFLFSILHLIPVDTGRKLNVHKTFRRRIERLYVRSIYVLRLLGYLFPRYIHYHVKNNSPIFYYKNTSDHYTRLIRKRYTRLHVRKQLVEFLIISK